MTLSLHITHRARASAQPAPAVSPANADGEAQRAEPPGASPNTRRLPSVHQKSGLLSATRASEGVSAGPCAVRPCFGSVHDAAQPTD